MMQATLQSDGRVLITNGVMRSMVEPHDTFTLDAIAPGIENRAAILNAWADFPEPPPYVEPAPTPVTRVSPRQARLALLDAGLLDTVETELAKPENKAALISWEYATSVERDSPLIATIGGALGMTEQQIDDLFTAAAAL